MNDEIFSVKKFLKNIAGFSLASWVQAGINLISIPLVTRTFPTEEYGKITLFITVYTIITLCVRLSLEQGYTRFYYEHDERGRKDLLSQCFCINIITFLITYVLLFCFNRTISTAIFGEEAVLVICAFLPVIVVCNTIIEYQRVNFKMSENIKAYFILSVLSVLAGKCSILLAAFSKPTYFNAILYMACAFLIQFFVVWVLNPEGFKLSKLHIEKQTAIELIRYSLPFLVASLLVYLNNFISSMVLKSTLSYTAVAIFSATTSIANIAAIVQAGFSIYWGPFMYQNYQTKQPFIKQVHSWVMFLVMIFYLTILIFQDLLFVILGENYRSGKPIFAFVLIPILLSLVVETTVYGSYINKKSIHTVYASILSFVSNVVIGIVTIPYLGLLGAALAVSISSIATFVYRTILGQREYSSVDDIFKTMVAIALIFICALINYFVTDTIIKTGLYFLSLFVTVFVYRDKMKKILRIIHNRKNSN